MIHCPSESGERMKQNEVKICTHFHYYREIIRDEDIHQYYPDELAWFLLRLKDDMRELLFHSKKIVDIYPSDTECICSLCGQRFPLNARVQMKKLFHHISATVLEHCIEHTKFDDWWLKLDDEWQSKYEAYILRWNYLSGRYPALDFSHDERYLQLGKGLEPVIFREFDNGDKQIISTLTNPKDWKFI